jgi:hypothetical protein
VCITYACLRFNHTSRGSVFIEIEFIYHHSGITPSVNWLVFLCSGLGFLDKLNWFFKEL